MVGELKRTTAVAAAAAAERRLRELQCVWRLLQLVKRSDVFIPAEFIRLLRKVDDAVEIATDRCRWREPRSSTIGSVTQDAVYYGVVRYRAPCRFAPDPV